MRLQSKKIIAVLALFVYWSSFCVLGFSPKALAHELDHAFLPLTVSTDHEHASHHDDSEVPNPEPLSEIDHQLLHAMSHSLLIVASAFESLSESCSPVPTPFIRGVMPPLVTEPPFRPPPTTLAS